MFAAALGALGCIIVLISRPPDDTNSLLAWHSYQETKICAPRCLENVFIEDGSLNVKGRALTDQFSHLRPIQQPG